MNHLYNNSDVNNSTDADRFLLETILNNLSEAVAYFDSNNILIRWNDIFTQLFEFDDVWLKTQPTFSAVSREICGQLAPDAPSLTRDWWEAAGKHNPNVTSIPIELCLNNGRVYRSELSALSTQGRVLLLYDVTILVQREASLRQSNRDLEQFAYIASHDLQEPLRMVASFTELLQKKYHDKLDETANGYIQYAVNGAHRMQRLLNDLLQFSRINNDPPDNVPINIEDVCNCAIDDLSTLIGDSKAEISIKTKLPTVPGNFTQLTQVFQNLIKNAITFNKVSPQISISSEYRNGLWIFQINDNGFGIDEIHMDKIFIIFQRLHNRQVSDGNGLGLAICKKIVENHGGRIWVDSLIGQGSTFTFTLPMVSNHKHFKQDEVILDSNYEIEDG